MADVKMDCAGSIIGPNNMSRTGGIPAITTVDPVTETVNPVLGNQRFEVDPINPMLFTDLLTKRQYRILAVGEPEVPPGAVAPKHLIKTATKAVVSLNSKHQNDYFWGDFTPATRTALKGQEINNMHDLLSKVDNLDKLSSASLVEVIKLIVTLKV